MSFFSRFRRAVDASLGGLGPGPFRAKGTAVVCPVCGGAEFVRTTGGANMKPMLLGLNAPWLKLDRYVTHLTCTHCAYLLSFGKAPEPDEDAG